MLNTLASPKFVPLSTSTFPEALTVLVVDDARIVRDRLVEMLMETGLVGIIGLAVDVRTAMEAIEEADPQVIILDIGLPGTLQLHNGIDLLRWIKQTHPSMYVVMLTNLSDVPYREAAQRLGSYAFLDKSREFEQLPRVIEEIADAIAS